MTKRYRIVVGAGLAAIALVLAFATRESPDALTKSERNMDHQLETDQEPDLLAEQPGEQPTQAVTFTRDIAPIFFRQCAGCHRPGEAGPFPLLQYDECRSHALQIADVVRRKLMPPWLPDSQVIAYTGQRVLTETEIESISRWVDGGTLEGDPSDLPPQPQWVDGWRLGRPDMVLQFPRPFTLPAGGGDVFRNFVIPVELSEKKYVRAVEIRPLSPRVVHHGVLLIDSTVQSRRLDEEDAEPGFGGMIYGSTARSPDGFFIGWTPGKMPFQAPSGMAWDLNPGTDIVLQLHLIPSGKTEQVEASIGLFFSDKPPSLRPMVLRLGLPTIDIPAGDSEYRIQDQFQLPVDVELLSVYPHAHYLGRRMQGDIVHRDGTRQPLLRIAEWDFKWQDEYRFPKPIPVKKGANLTMEFSYDNSAENVRNPSSPPRRVTFGPQSSDEMGDLWVQVLPRNEQDRDLLKAARVRKDFESELKGCLLEVKVRPEDHKARYNLACMLETIGELDAAASQYTLAFRLNTEHAPSINNLGVVRCKQRRYAEAIPLLEKALKLNPDLEDARYNLNLAREALAAEKSK